MSDQQEDGPRLAGKPNQSGHDPPGDPLAAERAARLAAERINTMRDEFLGLVSHELRTPLNAMVGWLHVLGSSGEPVGQIAKRAVAGLERAVHQQRELVDTLLETARALRGDLTLARERVDLGAVVAAAVLARQDAVPALGIDVEPGPAGCAVLADPRRLRYVFNELLAHAAKFADLGRLRISIVSLDDGRIAAAFGFDSPDAGVAWEPFREPGADEEPGAAPLRRRRGSSIGLVLCERLIELSGGAMRVGAGQAGLQVVLPCASAQAAAPEEPGVSSAPTGCAVLADLDVLVVDDQPEMREVLSTILAHGGARAHSAATAAEGATRYAELASSGQLDIGVLDIAMPAEDGIGLVRRIREQERSRKWRRMPMIALTAHASGAMREQALRAGFDAFLAKPLMPGELYDTIARILARRAA